MLRWIKWGWGAFTTGGGWKREPQRPRPMPQAQAQAQAQAHEDATKRDPDV
jgi:hypothetical protein